MNKRALEDIYQNEMHPELYIERQKASRRRKIEEAVSGLVIFLLFAATIAIVQVAYNIW